MSQARPPAYCADSSIAIAAFASWHEHHGEALAAIGSRPPLVAHAALETYSVLTRLPSPFRADAGIVVEFLARSFPGERPSLSKREQLILPERLHEAGVRGGAVYDGLVGLTAAGARLALLSLDQRAARTYARLGVEHRLLV